MNLNPDPPLVIVTDERGLSITMEDIEWKVLSNPTAITGIAIAPLPPPPDIVITGVTLLGYNPPLLTVIDETDPLVTTAVSEGLLFINPFVAETVGVLEYPEPPTVPNTGLAVAPLPPPPEIVIDGAAPL